MLRIWRSSLRPHHDVDVLQRGDRVRRDERFGKTRIINPGALHRASEKTVALLDLATDQLEFIRVA